MNKIKLYYGMKLLFPANPIEWVIPSMRIALSSNSKEEMTEFTVSKYWENDTDANKYKVKLIPTDDKRFGNEKLYSSDLISLINHGTVKMI